MLADRVKETTATTGTGTLTLAGAASGFRSFSSAFAAGGRVRYAITGATEWETGTGTLLTATTLSRDTVSASSNAGALVNFSAGSKDVFCTAIAEDFNLGMPVAIQSGLLMY